MNLRAPGQYFLAESGLMQNWHRQYDPSLGRYIQPDPIDNVLATQPVNLDGSSLIANGGITGSSQLAPSIASAPNTGNLIGAELPTFTDGPSIFNYAKSAPGMYVDPTGQAGIVKILRIVRDICLIAFRLYTGDPHIRPPPATPEPAPVVRPTPPPKLPRPPVSGAGPAPPDPPKPPTPPFSK